MPSPAAVFVDLDRTLLCAASGPTMQAALTAEGVLPEGRRLPGERVLYGIYNRFGESVPFIGLARAAATMMRGKSAEATRQAGRRAVEALLPMVQPYALDVLAAHRAEGRTLVLATTSPEDLVRPLADTLGFDDVIATRYAERDGCYTGNLDGGFVWGPGKRKAVAAWAAHYGVALSESHAYSDSFFDVPLLQSVGHPHALNADPRLVAVAMARRWPLEQWDRAPGVPSLLGFEPYDFVRPFLRREFFPYARFTLRGLEHLPKRGPVLIAANHRSYFDVAALAIMGGKGGRPVRFLAKQELFDAPVIGSIARSMGGIPVDRGTGSSEPMERATAALRAGECVLILPQGTIPRGEAFFDPVLVGKTGAARLAAETGAPVIPVGLWGTEAVWPRSCKLPNMTTVAHPPTVTVTIGAPVELGLEDPQVDTATLMAAIVDLLPPEARTAYVPTEDELARTQPSS